MTAPRHEDWIIADPLACTALGEHHDLAVAVGPDGSTWPIIRDRRVTVASVVLLADGVLTTAPHEDAAPLSPAWLQRVRLAEFRCGRPTRTTGTPCRTPVTAPGLACGNHRAPTRTEPNR